MSDVRLIVAVGKQGQIGLDGKLPWHDAADLKWFRKTTTEDPNAIVVLGRKTYDSIMSKNFPVLPERTLLVQSRDKTVYMPYCHGERDFYNFPVLTPEEILEKVNGVILWIAGGADIYEMWLPFVNRFYISRIDYDGPADIYFHVPVTLTRKVQS